MDTFSGSNLGLRGLTLSHESQSTFLFSWAQTKQESLVEKLQLGHENSPDVECFPELTQDFWVTLSSCCLDFRDTIDSRGRYSGCWFSLNPIPDVLTKREHIYRKEATQSQHRHLRDSTVTSRGLTCLKSQNWTESRKTNDLGLRRKPNQDCLHSRFLASEDTP